MPRKKAPAAEAPRLVAYYRYSGGSRQTEQSIEGQRRDCEAYARAHGMTILREYVDRHISGKTDDRPAFQQLVADSAAHTFDAVICWKTDRLARNRYDSAVYKKKLRDNGVEILYAAESNISGAEGIIIEGLMEALAEYYSAELAEKARRGMRESALKGKALGSSRPLGLTVDADKHYVIEPKGAEAVRYIFEQYAAGLSSSSIVELQQAEAARPDPEKQALEKSLSDVRSKIQNILTAIENGTSSAALSARLADLEQQESTLSYQLSSLTAKKPLTFTRDQILFLLQQFRVSPSERTKAYCRRLVDTFVDHIELTNTELILYFNISDETIDKNKKAPRSNPSKESSTEKRLVRVARIELTAS